MFWIEQVVLEQAQNISPPDMELFTVVDTADEVVEYITHFYQRHLLKPNF